MIYYFYGLSLATALQYYNKENNDSYNNDPNNSVST